MAKATVRSSNSDIRSSKTKRSTLAAHRSLAPLLGVAARPRAASVRGAPAGGSCGALRLLGIELMVPGGYLCGCTLEVERGKISRSWLTSRFF